MQWLKRKTGQLNAACYFLSQMEEGKGNEQKKRKFGKKCPLRGSSP